MCGHPLPLIAALRIPQMPRRCISRPVHWKPGTMVQTWKHTRQWQNLLKYLQIAVSLYNHSKVWCVHFSIRITNNQYNAFYGLRHAPFQHLLDPFNPFCVERNAKERPGSRTCWWWWSCAVLEQVAAAATITQLIIAACPRDPQSVPTVHHQQGRALHLVLFQATHCAILYLCSAVSCQKPSLAKSVQKQSKMVASRHTVGPQFIFLKKYSGHPVCHIVN